MTVAQVRLTLAIYACPERGMESVEALLPQQVKLSWRQQTLLQHSQSLEVSLRLTPLEVDDLISSLSRVSGLHFEAIQMSDGLGQLFMFVPGLGMYRADTNGAGEILISEERIRNAVEQAAGNAREMQRLIRTLLGQTWDDVLEPFRAQRYNQNVALLNRAV